MPSWGLYLYVNFFGSEATFESGTAGDISAVYDPDRKVPSYVDEGLQQRKSIAGTVSGKALALERKPHLPTTAQQ